MVAAVVAYLVKSGNKRFTKWIYVGVLAGLAGAGVVAVIFVLAFGGPARFRRSWKACAP